MKNMIGLLALALLAGCGQVDYCDGNSGVARDSALFASQTFVKGRLKAPATAVFPTSSDAQGVAVTETGTCTFTVIGFVDSQNSFGALIRSTYIAKVRAKGDRDYALEELVID